MFKVLDQVFDYTLDDFGTMYAWAWFGVILGTLLSILLILVVSAI